MPLRSQETSEGGMRIQLVRSLKEHDEHYAMVWKAVLRLIEDRKPTTAA
jgi:hypothetical protein